MNHGPFYFIDTRTYIRTDDAALSKLLHTRTDWTVDDSTAALPSDTALHDAGGTHARSLTQIKQKGISVGRSLSWGFLLYIGWRSGFWLTIFLQSTSVVLLLWLCLRALHLPVWRYIFPVGFLLAIVSDAAFYASYLMPDLYAGFAVIAIAILLSAGTAITARQYWPWFVLLTWSLLAHDSLLLLAAVCLGIFLVASVISKDWKNRRGFFILVSSLLVSILVQQGIAIGIHHVTGQEPLRFPLITARLIEDGPGAAYLKKICPASGFATCAYVDELPLTANDFLFCTTPKCGAYEVAGYDKRLQISKEQTRFLIAVFRDDPVGLVKADLKDTGEELLNLSMRPFLYSEGVKRAMDSTFPPSALTQIHKTTAYRGSWPVGLATAVATFITASSLAYIVFNFFGWLPGRNKHPMIVSLGLWCCAGVLLNAAICGALSEPSVGESRYQGRVIWILPLVVLLSESLCLLERQRRRSAEKLHANAPHTAQSGDLS